MADRIRSHMAQVDGDPPLGGVVEIDETFVGGYLPGGQGGKGKAIVMGMVEKGGGPLTRSADFKHMQVKHSVKEYVGREGETTNTIEGVFSQVEGAIAGTHISVSDKHPWKCAKEREHRSTKAI